MDRILFAALEAIGEALTTQPKDPHGEGEPNRTVWALDAAARTVDLSVGKRTAFSPHALRALFPDEIITGRIRPRC